MEYDKIEESEDKQMVDQIKEFIIDEMFKAKENFNSDDKDERLVALSRHHALESVLIMIFEMERQMQ